MLYTIRGHFRNGEEYEDKAKNQRELANLLKSIEKNECAGWPKVTTKRGEMADMSVYEIMCKYA